MSRWNQVFDTIVDATGAPVSAGLRYVYLAGTTTATTTYPTAADLAAATNANANPLVADAAGMVGPVFTTDGTLLKFVDKTAAGVTLRTLDNVTPSLDTSRSIITRVMQIGSNPVDYGALGDGVANEVSYVQSAIDGATAAGVVDLLGLTYKCNSAITLRNGVTLCNGTLNFSSATADAFILATGSLGSENLLTANVTFADGTVSVTTASGLAAGDLLSLYDTQDYIDGKNRGEVVEIESIASLVLSLQNAALDAYATASTAAVKRITPVSDVTLDGLTIIGAESISGTHQMVSLVNTRRTRIVNCTMQSIDSYGIVLSGAFDTVIESCTITDGATAGIIVADGSQHAKIRDNVFSGLDTSVIVGSTAAVSAAAASGIPRFVDISGCTFSYGGASNTAQILVNQDAQFVRVLDNTITMFSTAAGDGISVACVDSEVRGNEIYRDGTGTPEGIQLSISVPPRTGRAYAVRCTRNKIRTDGTGIVYAGTAITGGAGTLTLLDIGDNYINYTGSNNITVAAGNAATCPPITTLRVERNTVNGPISLTSSHASATIATIHLGGNNCESINIDGTTLSISRVFSTGNTVLGATTAKMFDVDNVALALSTNDTLIGDGVDTTHGFEFTACTNVAIRGGVSAGATTIAAFIDEATTIGIVGGAFSSMSQGIEIDNTTQEFTRCRIMGAEIVGATLTTAGQAALEIDASDATRSSNLQISDCYIEATDADADTYVVAITGLIDRVVISGNTCVRGSDDDAANIFIDGDAAGGITQGMIDGNVISGGLLGISAADVTSVYSGINVFESVTTPWAGLSNTTFTVTNDTPSASIDADTATSIGDGLARHLNDLEALGLVIKS